ncbi:MAG: hypothetical protein K2Q22_06325 [Cytophagales bacterium]|nr:hypothetical protein [Cytophagales bacterium]
MATDTLYFENLTDQCHVMEMMICLTGNKSRKFSIQFFDSYNTLPAVWHTSIPLGHSLTRPCIEVNESSHLEDVKFYYAIVYRNESPAAFFYFQHIEISNKHFDDFSGNDLISRHLYKYVSKKKFNLLVLGHLFMTDFEGYYYLPNAISKLEFYNVLNKTVNHLAKATNAHFNLLKDINGQLKNMLDNEPNGYHFLRNDIYMEMDIPSQWNSMEDYISALSRKYATRTKKLIEGVKPLMIKELTLEEIIRYAENIERLYLNVALSSSVKIGFVNGEYFVNLKAKLKSDFKVFGYFLNGEMIAFTSAILTTSKYEVYYIGLEHEKCQNYSVYLHMLVQGVEQAILNKKPLLGLGRTALEAKAITGCNPRYLNNYIKVKNTLLNSALNLLLEKFEKVDQGEKWKERNPFR